METKKQSVSDIAPAKPYKKSVPVHQYGLDGKFIKTFNSMNEASKITRAPVSSIAECIKGKFRTAGGFQWRKATD